MQADLDAWLDEFNPTRQYSGKYCYGKRRCRLSGIRFPSSERKCSTAAKSRARNGAAPKTPLRGARGKEARRKGSRPVRRTTKTRIRSSVSYYSLTWAIGLKRWPPCSRAPSPLRPEMDHKQFVVFLRERKPRTDHNDAEGNNSLSPL